MGTVPQSGRAHPVQLHLPELRTPLQADLPGGDRQLQAVRMPEKASGTVRNVRIFPKTYLNRKMLCQTAGELHRIALVRSVYSFCGFVQFCVVPKTRYQNRITDIGSFDADITIQKSEV